MNSLYFGVTKLSRPWQLVGLLLLVLGCSDGQNGSDNSGVTQDVAVVQCNCEVAEECIDGQCQPGPCSNTPSCNVFGKCTAVNGVCMAGSDDDCAASENCVDQGECRAGGLPYDAEYAAEEQVRHRACWKPAKDNSECTSPVGADERSQCRDAGRCKVHDGICIASSADDCKQSVSCTRWGACAYKNGECWRAAQADADCLTPMGPNNESPCGNFGFCTAKDGICVAGKDEDCVNSFVCRQWDECTAYDGECWQSARK